MDVEAAVSQSVAAGAGEWTNHHVKGVTGSSTVAGGVGAFVGVGVSSKLRGASDKHAMEAGGQAAMTAGAQEFARYTVHNATKCANTAGLAAEMITDVGDIWNYAVDGKADKAFARTCVSWCQAAFSVALSSSGPAGWLANTCLDHFVFRTCRDAIHRKK